MPLVINKKCCDSDAFIIRPIEPALHYKIDLYGNSQNTINLSNQQSTSFADVPLFTKKCHIIDRSTTAQESAINQNFKNAEATKEFICDYFDLSQYSFTKIVWSGVTFKVLGVSPYSSYTINRVRYNIAEGKYFVGIQAGVVKL